MRNKICSAMLLLALLLFPFTIGLATQTTLDAMNSSDVTIGVPTGASAMNAVEARFPNAKLQYFTVDTDGYLAVLAGKIDAFAHDTVLLQYACEQNSELQILPETFGETEICVGISRLRSELTAPVNAFITSLIADGTRDDMLRRWLTDADTARIAVSEPTAPEQTIRVGTSGIVTPMTYYGANGQLTGFDIELLERMGLALNAKIEISVMNYDALVAGLESGKLDLVVANLNVTPERAERIDYSIPYMTAASGLVVHAAAETTTLPANSTELSDSQASLSGFSTVEEMQRYFTADKTLGIQVGTTHDGIAARLFPDVQRAYYNSVADLLLALESGKLDGYMVEQVQGRTQCQTDDQLWMPDAVLEATDFGMALSFGHETLCAQLDKLILRMRGDGTLDALEDKWFQPEEAQKTLAAASTLPKTNGTIRIAVTGDDYPFAYLRDGQPVGYSVELAQLLCADLGYGLDLQVVDFAGMIAAVASGKADMATSCISITDERKEQMLFTEPIYTSGECVMLPASMKPETAMAAANDSLTTVAGLQAYFTADKQLGVQSGTILDQMATKHFPDAQQVYMPGSSDLVAALTKGKIDGYLVDQPQGYAQCLSDDRLWMPDVRIEEDHYGIALAFGQETLCEQLNTLIGEMKTAGELDALSEKWFLTDETQKPMAALPTTGEHGVLKLATSADSYPFSYMREGKPVGYSVELFGMLCEKLGYGCEVQIYDFGGMIAAIAAGKADAASDSISITAERKEQMLFTDPTYDGGVSMILPASLKPQAASVSSLGGEETAASGDASAQSELAAAWASISASFERTFLRENRWMLIVQGLLTTLEISVLSALLGTLLGFGVCMMRRSRLRVLSGLAKVFVSLMQGTPIVVFLMILYYIVFGDVDPILVAVVGFGLNFGAYVSEMMRTGIDAVDRGQIEAASAIGFTKVQTFLRITLPQAARHFLPVFRGEFISLVKTTSVVGYISIMDLTKMSDIIRSRTYEAFFPLIATAVIYFVLSWLLARVLTTLEKRIDPKRRKRTIKGVREEESAC